MQNLSLKTIILSVLIQLFACSAAHAQTGIDSVLAAKLQNSLNTLRTGYHVKGMYAAAFVPGKGIWKGVSGVSYDTIPMDTSMLLNTGSVTKTFVAAEIFKLIENNQLALDDSLSTLLPALSNVNGNITVRQLLGHKSGLADFLNANWQNAMFSNPTAIWYQPQPIVSFLPAPLAQPGGAWNYINTNYALLGMIIEAKKGDSLHTALRSDLLLPNGLSDTYMEVFEHYSNPIPHNWSTPNMIPAQAADASATPHEALWSSVEAAGGYFSNPVDLVKWGHALYSGQILSQGSLAGMTAFTPVSGGYFSGYGLGCMRFGGNGRTYWGHAGNFYGYAASLLYYPHDSICVAVLINQDCIASTLAASLMNTLITGLSTGVHDYIGETEPIVFPNPANEELYISLPVQALITQVDLSDVSGRTILSQQVKSKDAIIKTGQLEPGAYLLSVHSENGTFRKKIIVVH